MTKSKNRGCPTAEQVLAALDAGTEDAGSASILAHVRDCPYCREQGGVASEAAQLKSIGDTLVKVRLNARDYERIDRWKSSVEALGVKPPAPPAEPSDAEGGAPADTRP